MGAVRTIAAVAAFLIVVGTGASGAQPQTEAVRSYFPKNNLLRFIVDQLDVRTVSTSLLVGRNKQKKRHFSDFNVIPTEWTADGVSLVERNNDNWVIDIALLKRRDLNGDGIEDVAVCLTENAAPARGTYYSRHVYVLTRYSSEAPVIAIGLRRYDKNCPEVEH